MHPDHTSTLGKKMGRNQVCLFAFQGCPFRALMVSATDFPVYFIKGGAKTIHAPSTYGVTMTPYVPQKEP